jgi:hypothetical protein
VFEGSGRGRQAPLIGAMRRLLLTTVSVSGKRDLEWEVTVANE